jgi:hypothetical protein
MTGQGHLVTSGWNHPSTRETTLNIKSFMLTNGQELIAELQSEGDTSFTIKNPLVVHMMHGPEGVPQLGFAPWSMLHEEEPIELHKHAVSASPVSLPKKVEDSYIQNTTGLQLATSTGQILHG